MSMMRNWKVLANITPHLEKVTEKHSWTDDFMMFTLGAAFVLILILIVTLFNTYHELFEEYIEFPTRSWEIRRNVAANKKTSGNTLLSLAYDNNWRVRETVAKNENTSEDALMVLAKDKNWHVRETVIWNKNTPKAVLIELAKDKNADVREAVLCKVMRLVGTEYENIEKLLAVFAKDVNPRIRWIVAKNELTTPAVLKELAKDRDADVRMAVAKNQNANKLVLEILANAKK